MAITAFAALQKLCHGNFWKFEGSGERIFGGSEKDSYFRRFHNDTIRFFGVTSEESWFLIS